MNESPGLTYLATCLANSQYEEAAAFCEQEISVQPDTLSNYWHLGLVRLLQGEEEEAQAVWLSAATMADAAVIEAGLEELLEILYAEAERQLQLGNPHLAERIYWHCLDLAPEHPVAYFQLGQAVSLQGRLDDAIEHWQTAIDLQPDLAVAYSRQGEVFQTLREWDKAIAAYTRAIQLQPDGQLHYNLGVCFGRQQRWQEAIAQFNQTIQLQPNFAAAYGDRGWAWLQLQHWSEGIENLHIAVQQASCLAQTYCTWVELDESLQSETIVNNAQGLQALCQPDLKAAEQAFKQFLSRKLEQHRSIATATLSTPQQSIITPSTDSPTDPLTDPPTDFYETTHAWATLQPPEHYIPLNSSHWIELQPPKTIDREVHFSFRFGHTIPLPETFVAQIPQGRFWLNHDQTSSAVLTSDNQLLGDLSPEFPLLAPGHSDKHPRNHSIFSLKSLSSVQSIDGVVAVLSGLTNDMYFHWIFDVLPRIDLLHRSGICFDQIDHFLINDCLPFQQETLKILGIPDAKILATERHSHIQANRLIVPSYPSSPAWMPKWVGEWLRQVFLNQNGRPAHNSSIQTIDRLYISRQQTANRRIINEADVMERLGQLGFQRVVLESLTVLEQAALLANANVVISPHGGGLTNTVFCQPGTKIIELFSPHYVYPCYWLVSNLLDLDYYYVMGKIPEGDFFHQLLYPDPRLADIWIDLDDLQTILDLAGID